MNYEAEIDLRNANTSHAILVDLVGSGRRVLDVGCAAGDLGRILGRRGCRVVGVERDPEAAEAASKVLDEVLVGDLDDLDLVGHFGKESFDVVVFGDVLEHLPDPVEALRRVRPLLAENGSVVASIPNVAHGAVRLALLKGRFQYQALESLDSTPIRFFTRGSVYETFREAGLVPVDVRRTTAGVFETEIGVRREDFDPGVVDAVEGDPESTTHRFVLRAVPEGSTEAVGAPAAPVRETLSVGLVADWTPDDARTALAVRVLHAEMTRRLPCADVRVLSSSRDAGPGPHDGGLPVEALPTPSDARPGRLSAELDCLVVTGTLGSTGVAELAGLPVVWSGVRLLDGAPSPRAGMSGAPAPTYAAAVADGTGPDPGDTVGAIPDPLALVPRLLPADALARRLSVVRAMGWFPVSEPACVVEADASLVACAATVGRALDQAVAAGTAVLILTLDPAGAEAADAIADAMDEPVGRVPADAPVDDAVCIVANARAVVTAGPASAASVLARAYGVPVVGADRVGEALARALAPLGEAETPARHAPGGAGDVEVALDAHLDRVASIVEAAAAARARPAGGPALAPPEHVAAVVRANRRVRERLLAERLAIADHLLRQDDERRALQIEVERLEAEAAALRVLLRRTTDERGECESELGRLRAELEALRNIRILRALRPARAVYARLRGGRL